MKRVLIVDDHAIFCQHWKTFLEGRFPGLVQVETYTDPFAALRALSPDISLLMLDLQMPGLDGKKVLEFAAAKGWTAAGWSSPAPATRTTSTRSSPRGTAWPSSTRRSRPSRPCSS
jgi:CheY-like chemotaxis protein